MLFPYATFLMKAEVTHFFNGVVGVILLIIDNLYCSNPFCKWCWVPKKHLLTHRVFGALGVEKHAIFLTEMMGPRWTIVSEFAGLLENELDGYVLTGRRNTATPPRLLTWLAGKSTIFKRRYIDLLFQCYVCFRGDSSWQETRFNMIIPTNLTNLTEWKPCE